MLTLVKEFPAHTTQLSATRRLVATTFRQKRSRRRFLAQLGDDTAILHVLEFSDKRIAAMLDIEEYDVRAFCPKQRETISRRILPRRAVEALLHGRYASLGGRTIAKRTRHLVEIAAAYTWDELMAEPGVGTVAASEIRLWLEDRGSHLRVSDDALDQQQRCDGARSTGDVHSQQE